MTEENHSPGQGTSRQEIDEIVAAVLAGEEAEGPEEKARMEPPDGDALDSLGNVAIMAARYYQALVEAGLPVHLAEVLLIEWHRLFWQQGMRGAM